MASREQRGHVTGLASALEPAADAAAPSAVSGLLSRFEGASRPPADDAAVSSKISSIAGAFGETTASAAAKGSPLRGAAKTQVQVPAPPPAERVRAPPMREGRGDGVLAAAGGSFKDAASRFEAGRVEVQEVKESAFASAANAFEERAKGAQAPVETKVSCFAQRFENGGVGGEEEGRVKDVVREEAECAVGGVGAAKAVFEGGGKAKPAEGGDAGESITGRFKQATALFGDGEEAPAEGDGKSGKARFADAAKLFGGDGK